MSEKKITEIPANPVFHNIRKSRRRLRVAAYCRVSTEEEEQQNSFEVQIQYYTQKICGNPEWELAGIFADEGISGVSTRKRAQFNEMIALCKRRKIDMILTKSISRFARNTLDCIRYVRMLKSWGVRIIFEKENIDTANMNSEMILTCLSSFAQAESESISGNVTKGIRMGYRQGLFVFRYDRFLGYRKGADGKPEIVPEQAEIVRQIAQSYLNGNSLREIKRFLEDRNIPSPGGMRVWRETTILSILQNEKYKVDAELRLEHTREIIAVQRNTVRDLRHADVLVRMVMNVLHCREQLPVFRIIPALLIEKEIAGGVQARNFQRLLRFRDPFRAGVRRLLCV